ncbi:MAG: helix-turn-helix domain-containing protein [Microbacteriaceae bacterium]|nr:helix-turn-helix domain-containing protein [Microbacteriaceae bacterium]
MPDYSVPALDKAFDVLELLASRADPLSQTEIAEATGRSVSQLFRVLTTLEGRGWVFRDPAGLYTLSMAAFDLAHRHPPLRGLLVAATPPMRELSDRVRLSCNLSVLDMGASRVVAQVESPADFGYRVRVGALFPLDTATGTVLVEGGEPDVREQLAGRLAAGDRKLLAADGSIRRDDPLQPGITDLVVPVRDARGYVRAALTVPYVATAYTTIPADTVFAAATRAAADISARIQGSSQGASR